MLEISPPLIAQSMPAPACPTAATFCPGYGFFCANFRLGNPLGAFLICSSARSWSASIASTYASYGFPIGSIAADSSLCLPSVTVALIFRSSRSPPSITWWLVSTTPLGSMIAPEPTLPGTWMTTVAAPTSL